MQTPSVQVPSVKVPSVQAPSVAIPHAPPAGGGGSGQSVAKAITESGRALAGSRRGATSGRSGSGSRVGPGASGTGNSGTRSAGTGSGATSGANRPAQRKAARRAARERRFRRDVKRLAGCIDAVPGLSRRVLILRAGLQGVRPHSLRGAARTLHVSVERAAAAERSGLRSLRGAHRSGGCGAAAGGGSRFSAPPPGSLAATPVLAQLLGVNGIAATSQAGGAPPARGASHHTSRTAAPSGAAPEPKTAASAPPPPAPGGSGSGLALVLGLALLAAAVAALALRPGWRVAHGAIERRSERSTERRQRELVAAVHGILQDRER